MAALKHTRTAENEPRQVAIYARKSTNQSSLNDDQRSVTRQVDHARRYATRKGWTVADAHIYVDDGMSGAEFDRRPALQRLRATLKPRAPFELLIVSDQSRLSRDTADTLMVLKELARAGVKVLGYLDDRPISLDTPSDTLVTTINAWKDSEARREASVRTYDAMARKARAAHVTGGRVFGYRNVDVYVGVDAHGRPQRSHVAREIRDDEAAIVRRIFELCAAGYGVKRISAALNADAAPTPRAQRGRVNGWTPSSIHSILFRELYRGVVIWNKTKKRNAFGQVQPKDRASSEWLRIDAPDCRIVSEDLWHAAHIRLTRARANYLAGTQGTRWGRPVSGTGAKYLLTGIGRCGVCGGGLTVRSLARGAGNPRAFRYRCSTHHYRGAAICGNGLELRLETADDAVLDMVESEVLRPTVVNRAIELALDGFASEPGLLDRRRDLERQLATVNRKIAQLTAAVEEGGQLSALIDALASREAEQRRLQGQLVEIEAVEPLRPRDRRAVEARVREELANWRGLLRTNVAAARRVLEELLTERPVFTPDGTAERGYVVRATFAFGRICSQILRSLPILRHR